MIIVNMTMKEVCLYKIENDRAKAEKHRMEVTNGDYCRRFTSKELKLVVINQKSTFTKGKRYASTRLWVHQNEKY